MFMVETQKNRRSRCNLLCAVVKYFHYFKQGELRL